MAPETTALLFKLAIISETCSQNFYEGLAKKFCHEINIADFWKNMAADEAEHKEMLEVLQRSLTPAQLSAPAEQDILQIALENSRVQINDVLNMVKNLNDAYILAQLWENSEIYKVFEFLIAKFMPGEADGRFIRLHLMTHKKKLETFLLAFGKDGDRRNINVADPDFVFPDG
jgi:hypothetical protein